jgi:hypothetical protein
MDTDPRYGKRRQAIQHYLLTHPEIDDEDNRGDVIFHLGPNGRVSWEIVQRGEVRPADLAA